MNYFINVLIIAILIITTFYNKCFVNKLRQKTCSAQHVFNGRSGETRTPALMVPNHARYQLRYTPKNIYKKMVQMRRFELLGDCSHKYLKLARLPIPPHLHKYIIQQKSFFAKSNIYLKYIFINLS